jgi:hypothetical protein
LRFGGTAGSNRGDTRRQLANDLASYPRKCSLCRTYRNAPIRRGSGGRVAEVKAPIRARSAAARRSSSAWPERSWTHCVSVRWIAAHDLTAETFPPSLILSAATPSLRRGGKKPAGGGVAGDSPPGAFREARSAWPRWAYKPFSNSYYLVRSQGPQRVSPSATATFEAALMSLSW